MFQGTLLLGGAVLLSAIGIIGSTDFEKLEREKDDVSCCHKLDESIKMLKKDLEDCCDETKALREAIMKICVFVSSYVFSDR